MEVGHAAEGIDKLTSIQALRDRVDREIAAGQIGLDRAASQRQQVQLPAPVASGHTPHGEALGELERVPADLLREATRERPGTSFDDHVVVAGGATEQLVAQRATN